MPDKKQLYDKEKVFAGLAIFLVIIAFPLWYNLGKAGTAPQPKLPDKAKATACVMPAKLMKTEHMQLLNEWRDQVVRQGLRTYISADGQEFNMSLSNTCLDCHAEKAEFCDACHNYASVTPYCWDCHIDPKEKE